MDSFAPYAVGMERLSDDRYLAELQIGYLAECRPGEVLTIQTSGLGDSRFVRGIDATGKPRFEAALYFGETPV